MICVHTIPVPNGMTAEEAWGEIILLGQLGEGRAVNSPADGEWAVVEHEHDGRRCPYVLAEEARLGHRIGASRWERIKAKFGNVPSEAK